MKHIKLFEQFINERNAFLAARAKAIEEGLDEFEFNGKVYPVKSKTNKQQIVSEAEIKSEEEFKKYAKTVLKKAFGEDYDETKGQKVIDGILNKADGDYGAAVGMLTSSLG